MSQQAIMENESAHTPNTMDSILWTDAIGEDCVVTIDTEVLSHMTLLDMDSEHFLFKRNILPFSYRIIPRSRVISIEFGGE